MHILGSNIANVKKQYLFVFISLKLYLFVLIYRYWVKQHADKKKKNIL